MHFNFIKSRDLAVSLPKTFSFWGRYLVCVVAPNAKPGLEWTRCAGTSWLCFAQDTPQISWLIVVLGIWRVFSLWLMLRLMYSGEEIYKVTWLQSVKSLTWTWLECSDFWGAGSAQGWRILFPVVCVCKWSCTNPIQVWISQTGSPSCDINQGF